MNIKTQILRKKSTTGNILIDYLNYVNLDTQ